MAKHHPHQQHNKPNDPKHAPHAKGQSEPSTPPPVNEPATTITTQTQPTDPATTSPTAGEPSRGENVVGTNVASDLAGSGVAVQTTLAGSEALPPVATDDTAKPQPAPGEAMTTTGLPASHPAASLPVGVAGSPVTREDVPATDRDTDRPGNPALFTTHESDEPLGVDDDPEHPINQLPIGVAGSLQTRDDIANGDPKQPAQEEPAVGSMAKPRDKGYRVVNLALPLVDMHGYARREFFLSSEDADTLRDLAAGLQAVGEKLDGTLIDRPEKAIVWLLRRIREEAAEMPPLDPADLIDHPDEEALGSANTVP